MTLQDRSQLATARRVVVKVGSSSITGERAAQLDELVTAIAEARVRGTQVVLVSSGAIASGLPLLQLTARPNDLATQQAAAAVGQNALMHRYQSILDEHDIVAGQILLTASDMEDPTSRSNARRAMDRLLDLGVLPIVNENDTVATQEIRFGDNDRLAALVAVLLRADALVLLSDIDSLYTKPPGTPGAEPIRTVPIDDHLDGVELGGVGSGVGSGGASTKVSAAKMAAEAGTAVLLTSTAQVSAALAGRSGGTWFEPAFREVLPTGQLPTV